MILEEMCEKNTSKLLQTAENFEPEFMLLQITKKSHFRSSKSCAVDF